MTAAAHFFEHQAYLSARVQCPEHGVHLVNVPWARPGSGFTLLFEAAMLAYAKQMPIAPLARMAREHLTAPRWKPPFIRIAIPRRSRRR